MPGTGVLRVIQFFNSSTVVRLNITKLPENPPTGWTLAGLGVLAAREIPQPVDAPATSAFEYRRERLESDQCGSANRVKTSVVRLAWIGKTATECVIRPLKEQIGDGVEYRVLIDRLFLEFNAADLAEPVLVVLKDRAWEELVDNLRLSARECHYTFSMLNHWRSL